MISFHQASENDIETLRDLAERSWQSAYAEILSPQQIAYMLENMYSPSALLNDLQNTNYRYFLIKDHNSALGFIGFEFHYERVTTKLHRIYLLAQAKGKGIGKNALEFLKNQASDVNDRRIILNVNKNNPAQHFYKAQGFSVYAEGIFDIGSGFVMDDYLMELIL
ncbi:GNAT family N-acetyltransferase [Kaistella palustris]|uniref:GNAT family N-acetyltransferase n=1 Tax=Kaistella palustris TaxID=493376 RepID=UPI00041DE6CA|nr:GNAT family N-acetyltransferase [Kaistella palustris]